ncbi:MAG: DUF58 domain-containing protein [Phycisphaerales bacterium]
MRRRYHLHLPGLLYVALTVLVGIAAANRPNNLLVWVFGAMLAGVLISGLVSGGMLMGVRAVRLDPRRGAVGEPLIVRYAITNRGRVWPVFSLQLEELSDGGAKGPATRGRPTAPRRTGSGWVLHVGPGETTHGEIVYFPQRRGRIVFERFRIWTTFPFGLIRKSVTFTQRTETLVYPRVLRLRDDLIGSLVRGGIGGFRLSTTPGPGEDYFGVREYRPGDSVRQIAWKRVASGLGLVSIERSRTSPPRLRVVLNVRTPTDQLRLAKSELSGRDVEENAISLAASLIAVAESNGYEVGLTVLGLDAPRAPLRRGRWHVEKLMAALAAIDLDAPRAENAGFAEADRDRATVVVVHVDRAAPSVAPTGAWHLVASNLDTLLAGEAPQETREAAR